MEGYIVTDIKTKDESLALKNKGLGNLTQIADMLWEEMSG